MNCSVTNVPSFRNTWMRSVVPSHTDTRPSLEMRTTCTIRNCGGGGPSGLYWLGLFSCCTTPLNGPGSRSPARVK